MTGKQWGQIVFFRESENWGDTEILDFDLVKTCDMYRHYIGSPMVVSCGTQGEHSQLSLHYSGLAVDFVFAHRTKPLLDLFLDALRFDFSEVGLYPDWAYGGKTVGGIHLGRSKGKAGRRKMWIAIDGKKGRAYLPANLESIVESGLLEEVF